MLGGMGRVGGRWGGGVIVDVEDDGGVDGMVVVKVLQSRSL